MNFSEFEQSNDEDSNEESSQFKSTPKGRKKIRKIIEDEDLRAETQEALREEEERRKRLANRDQQMEDRREVRVYISNVTTHFSNKSYIASNSNLLSELKHLIVIFQIIDDEQSQLCPITTKLVLDQDEETKMPIVQVHRNLVTRLKPHQVDGQSVLFEENINEHSLSLFHRQALKWRLNRFVVTSFVCS